MIGNTFNDQDDDVINNDSIINNIKHNNETNCKNVEDELNKLYKSMTVTDETSCGIGIIKGPLMQKLANKKVFIVVYGITGCLISSTFAYFNGSITTIEKRFGIPSRTTGVIAVGNDITQLFVSILISYYGGKGHRPRWIAYGIILVSIFCFLMVLPHFLYGAGDDALRLTKEYGNFSSRESSNGDYYSKNNVNFCHENDKPICETEGNSFVVLIMFLAQLISGVGGTMYYTLGFSYMDDNVKKSKSPGFISFSYFIRTLGPPIGYTLVSICLKMYISPHLTPVIKNKDPRWLGAWWLGWIVQGLMLLVMAFVLAMLPKTLPRAAVRRNYFNKLSRNKTHDTESASLADMWRSIKVILNNRVYLYSQISTMFYLFGYLPYWMYLPKYIEIQYKQSASTSSFVTGIVGLVCSALGILVAGIVIQKFKPSARMMASWNFIIGLVALAGVFSYAFLGCSTSDQQFNGFITSSNISSGCSSQCSCDYARYSPVCALDQSKTFISPCHAGCTQSTHTINGSVIFVNCSCIDRSTWNIIKTNMDGEGFDIFKDTSIGGAASRGPCSIDCLKPFYLFMSIVCLLKFLGSSGRVTNVLVSVRCVAEKDKTLSLGLSMAAMSLFAFIPSPIVYGFIMDSSCLLWGKACSASGNCWLYNSKDMRNKISFTSASFLLVAVIFDFLVVTVVKTMKNVYDDADGDLETNIDISKHEEMSFIQNNSVDENNK